ncbi:hypothetical protein BACCIP111899_02197 [Bacillus rhizoplanae]|uniref:Uncharacterized protein n=1 Tax=Bacillus rhizoplanae TaxID=2880966 RepID=A0ABM8YBD1_9BACI|nr:hypothetical protein BACCIP111899_02197 [Bacillus rhizoplanae]
MIIWVIVIIPCLIICLTPLQYFYHSLKLGILLLQLPLFFSSLISPCFWFHFLLLV